MPSLHWGRGGAGDGDAGGSVGGTAVGEGGASGDAGGLTGSGAGGEAGGGGGGDAGGLGAAGLGDSVVSVRDEQPASFRSTLPSLSSSLPLEHCVTASGDRVGEGSGDGLISTTSGSTIGATGSGLPPKGKISGTCCEVSMAAWGMGVGSGSGSSAS